MGMILVKDVVLAEIKGRTVRLNHGLDKFKGMFTTDEVVNGTNFVNSRGELICLGATKRVQETLGVVFGNISRLGLKVAEQAKTIDKLERKLFSVERKHSLAKCSLESTTTINAKLLSALDKDTARMASIAHSSIRDRLLFLFRPKTYLKRKGINA